MKSFHLTPRARADLEAIWEYIADDNLEAADRVLDGLQSACSMLGQNPAIGHLREDLTSKPVRFWSSNPYLLVYRPGTRPVEIVAIIHSARDLAAILLDIKT